MPRSVFMADATVYKGIAGNAGMPRDSVAPAIADGPCVQVDGPPAVDTRERNPSSPPVFVRMKAPTGSHGCKGGHAPGFWALHHEALD